jgi:hypothetical protein
MEVGQVPNWGCSAKGKKTVLKFTSDYILRSTVLLKDTRTTLSTLSFHFLLFTEIDFPEKLFAKC